MTSVSSLLHDIHSLVRLGVVTTPEQFYELLGIHEPTEAQLKGAARQMKRIRDEYERENSEP